MALVVGNWKMNLGVTATRKLLTDLSGDLERMGGHCSVWVAPPFTSLWAARNALGDESSIGLGAQDVHHAPSGAYTGSISASMIAEVGCLFALIGHSERRHGLNERGETLTKKAQCACEHGITPLFCVGELASERERGLTFDVLRSQLRELVSAPQVRERQRESADNYGVVVAYEPVWAIGTGIVASLNDISDAHHCIREELTAAGLAAVPILYGGSVTADNAADILRTPGVDGVLVGGASLKVQTFLPIINAASGR